MIKKIVWPVFFVLFLILIPPTFYSLDYSQTIDINQEKVVYNLAYPGLLPDHPLYLLKIIRDRILELTTRDNLRKAELYLLLSDKRVSMAYSLAKKGKNKLAITTLSKGEKYFYKIPDLIANAKKQGVSPGLDLTTNLKLSNKKHREVIDDLQKELPQGQTEGLSEVLRLNQEIKKMIEKY